MAHKKKAHMKEHEHHEHHEEHKGHHKKGHHSSHGMALKAKVAEKHHKKK